MNANDIFKYGNRTFLGSLEGLDEGDWEKAGACGVWSIKDIVAHLASYETVMVDVLNSFNGSASTPHLTRFVELGGDFNDSEVAARKERTIREVLDEYNNAHAQVVALAAQITPESFRQNGTLPWYGSEYSLDDLIVYTSYGHKREHSAQIAAFRDNL